MNVIAVIPARGGSKGVPRKSIRPVNGAPLIVYPIRAALAASRVDAVVVTTDDDEIAEIAADAGAEVVRRPAELAVDSIMPEPAIIHVLDSRQAGGHTDPDITVLVQTTAPLVESRAEDCSRGPTAPSPPHPFRISSGVRATTGRPSPSIMTKPFACRGRICRRNILRRVRSMR